jgi:hypothetical protein
MADEVHSSAGYAASTGNLNAASLASDNVFTDGSSLQVTSIMGSVAAGFVTPLSFGCLTKTGRALRLSCVMQCAKYSAADVSGTSDFVSLGILSK